MLSDSIAALRGVKSGLRHIRRRKAGTYVHGERQHLMLAVIAVHDGAAPRLLSEPEVEHVRVEGPDRLPRARRPAHHVARSARSCADLGGAARKAPPRAAKRATPKSGIALLIVGRGLAADAAKV